MRIGYPVLVREVTGRRVRIAFYKWLTDDTVIEDVCPINHLGRLNATDMRLAQRSHIFDLKRVLDESDWQPEILPFVEATP
mgnify:CR=1 FL=1